MKAKSDQSKGIRGRSKTTYLLMIYLCLQMQLSLQNFIAYWLWSFMRKKRTNVCVLLKTSSYVFKKEIKLLFAYNIISHIVQHSFHLKTKLDLGRFTKTNSVQSRTERHPYSLARLDEMKKKRMNITLCWVPWIFHFKCWGFDHHGDNGKRAEY